MVPPVYHSFRREEIKCRNPGRPWGQILAPNLVWRWDSSQNCCRTNAWTASSSKRTSCPLATTQIRSPTLHSWEGFRRDLKRLNLWRCQVRRQTAMWAKEVRPVLLQEWSPGNEGVVHAGTTPVIHGQARQAELFTRHYPCCFAKYSSWIARKPIQSWEQWTEWQHSCHVWNVARVFRFWFYWSWRTSTSTTATAVDPLMAQMLRQQMLLTQEVMDLFYRTGPGLPQQPVQQTPSLGTTGQES